MNGNTNNTRKSDLLNSINTSDNAGYGINQAAEIFSTPARIKMGDRPRFIANFKE